MDAVVEVVAIRRGVKMGTWRMVMGLFRRWRPHTKGVIVATSATTVTSGAAVADVYLHAGELCGAVFHAVPAISAVGLHPRRKHEIHADSVDVCVCVKCGPLTRDVGRYLCDHKVYMLVLFFDQTSKYRRNMIYFVHIVSLIATHAAQS